MDRKHGREGASKEDKDSGGQQDSLMSDNGASVITAAGTENIILRQALEEIRDVANVSEGVEFYAMLAEKALDDANKVYADLRPKPGWTM